MGMLGPLLQLLTTGAVPGFEVKRDGGSVKVSIPKSHPKADKLLALAKELATRKTTPSGIFYDTGPNDSSVDRILALLKDIVDMEYLMAELNRQEALKTKKNVSDGVEDLFKDPLGVYDSLLGSPLMDMLKISSDSQQRMSNMIDEEKAKQ